MTLILTKERRGRRLSSATEMYYSPSIFDNFQVIHRAAPLYESKLIAIV